MLNYQRVFVMISLVFLFTNKQRTSPRAQLSGAKELMECRVPLLGSLHEDQIPGYSYNATEEPCFQHRHWLNHPKSVVFDGKFGIIGG